MTKQNGWWDLHTTLEWGDELSECDLEHIAKIIKEGYTGGQIVGTGDEE